MALVIKEEMPKACFWYDENNKYHQCFHATACSYFSSAIGCPIIGKIPDEHGPLKDANEICMLMLRKGLTAEQINIFTSILLEASTIMDSTI